MLRVQLPGAVVVIILLGHYAALLFGLRLLRYSALSACGERVFADTAAILLCFYTVDSGLSFWCHRIFAFTHDFSLRFDVQP